MSIKNKLLLISIDKRQERNKQPIKVTIDFDLEGRYSRTSKKGGYLSSRLASYKQSLEPIVRSKRLIKKQYTPSTEFMTGRRSSLQLLPKLHQYDIPLESIPFEQKVDKTKQNYNKILSMKILNDNKSKRKQLRGLYEKDQIDDILLNMLQQQGAVYNAVKVSLQKSQQLIKQKLLFNRKSVQPRIQTLICQGKQFSPKDDIFNSRRQSQYKKNRSTTNQHNSVSNKKPKKIKQLQGWKVEDQNDFNDF